LLRFCIYLFAGSRYRLPSEGGRIIAISFNPSTFTFLLPCCLFRVATQAARGAQYSPVRRAVNTLSFFFFGDLLAPEKTGSPGHRKSPYGEPGLRLLRRTRPDAAAELKIPARRLSMGPPHSDYQPNQRCYQARPKPSARTSPWQNGAIPPEIHGPRRRER
jgi:hypothetical protein